MPRNQPHINKRVLIRVLKELGFERPGGNQGRGGTHMPFVHPSGRRIRIPTETWSGDTIYMTSVYAIGRQLMAFGMIAQPRVLLQRIREAERSK